MTGMSIRPSKTSPDRYAACMAATLPSVRGATPSSPGGVMLRALPPSISAGHACVMNGQPSWTSWLGSFQPPTVALRSRNSAGVRSPSTSARSPYWTPTLSHVDRANPVAGSRPYTLTASFQCVHSTFACCSGVIPGAVPNFGLSASGERPRQPLTHSVEPGARSHGVSCWYGFATVSDAARPSIRDRLDHTPHFDAGSARTFKSSHRSSSSQSPTWMVWVTMSVGVLRDRAVQQPAVVLPVDVLLDAAARAAEPDGVLGVVVLGDEPRLDHQRRL